MRRISGTEAKRLKLQEKNARPNRLVTEQALDFSSVLKRLEDEVLLTVDNPPTAVGHVRTTVRFLEHRVCRLV